MRCPLEGFSSQHLPNGLVQDEQPLMGTVVLGRQQSHQSFSEEKQLHFLSCPDFLLLSVSLLLFIFLYFGRVRKERVILTADKETVRCNSSQFFVKHSAPSIVFPSLGRFILPSTWRVCNGLWLSPRQVGVFQTSPNTSLCPGAEIQTLPWQEGVCVFFFHLLLFKHDLCPLPWGRLGSSSQAGSMPREAAAPLGMEKNPNTWRHLKIATWLLYLNIFNRAQRGNVALQYLCLMTGEGQNGDRKRLKNYSCIRGTWCNRLQLWEWVLIKDTTKASVIRSWSGSHGSRGSEISL